MKNDVLDRDELITHIKNNIRRISDAILSDVYKHMYISMNQGQVDNSSIQRRDKIIYVENNIEFIEDNDLMSAYKIMTIPFIETPEDKKYNVVLDLFNKILNAVEKPSIKTLIEFTDFPRDLMISDVCKNIVDQNMNFIFENGFTRSECKTYCKVVKNPHITILRAILKKIGYDLSGGQKNVKECGSKNRFLTYYSIKKIRNS